MLSSLDFWLITAEERLHWEVNKLLLMDIYAFVYISKEKACGQACLLCSAVKKIQSLIAGKKPICNLLNVNIYMYISNNESLF